MRHPLEIWREINSLNQTQASKKLGVAAPHISQIESGVRSVGKEVALRIERATGGDLQAADLAFFKWPDKAV